MNENKYYLKVDNRIVAECIPLEYALIFIKSIFENYYNDHEIVISIAEMEQRDDAIPNDMDKYCGKCGQAIDWSDIND